MDIKDIIGDAIEQVTIIEYKQIKKHIINDLIVLKFMIFILIKLDHQKLIILSIHNEIKYFMIIELKLMMVQIIAFLNIFLKIKIWQVLRKQISIKRNAKQLILFLLLLLFIIYFLSLVQLATYYSYAI